MFPVFFPQCNVEYAKDQPEYRTLHAWTDGRVVVSMWRLSLFERLKILLTGKLWLRQLTFGDPLQPQLPQVDAPKFQEEKEEE